MKYKVGDKVRVKKNLEVGKQYGTMHLLSDMGRFRGKVVTINRVHEPITYGIEGYDNEFWTDEMFEGLAEETPIKFRVGDRVRRIHHDNSWCDGTKLKVGEIVTVVKINSKNDISVDINGKIKAGNDPEYFELVKEESIPEPTPVININVTINHYDNACWYCRKGGLVDLYLDGAMGICPNCKRVCNDIRRSCPVDIERKPSKRKNEPLTIEELKALPVGTKVYIVWRWDMRSDTKREPKWDESGWGVKTTEERCNWKSPESDTNWQSIDSYDRCFDAWLTEPERPEPELPF